MIREAALDDCEKIATLLDELGYPATEQFALTQLARFSSRLDAKVPVAETEAEVVGVLCIRIIPLFHLSEELARITTLVVSSRFKPTGSAGNWSSMPTRSHGSVVVPVLK
jgi:N-acetylglutamate synthase-like GNAT family acetyltransferase